MRHFSTLHVANTQFEEELKNPKINHLSKTGRFLYFLPFLYAEPGDCVFTMDFPDQDYFQHLEKLGLPNFQESLTLQPVHADFLQPWGYTSRIAQFAESCHIPYHAPPLDVVSLVNSKEWSHLLSPLPGSRLLQDRKDLENWIKDLKTAAVLKTTLGFSGRGHLMVVPDHAQLEDLYQFALPEWRAGRKVLAEPWVERVRDFSTQWWIDENITYLGMTEMHNSKSGTYLGTTVGPKKENEYLFIHEVVEILQEKGYFGPVGVDSFIYKTEQGESLQPVCEINARMTMALVALKFQRKYFPRSQLTFSFSPQGSSAVPLLPFSLTSPTGQHIKVQKQFFLGINSLIDY